MELNWDESMADGKAVLKVEAMVDLLVDWMVDLRDCELVDMTVVLWVLCLVDCLIELMDVQKVVLWVEMTVDSMDVSME